LEFQGRNENIGGKRKSRRISVHERDWRAAFEKGLFDATFVGHGKRIQEQLLTMNVGNKRDRKNRTYSQRRCNSTHSAAKKDVGQQKTKQNLSTRSAAK
jgi:hypothetical protein